MNPIQIIDGYYYYHITDGSTVPESFWPIFKVGYLSAYGGLDREITHDEMGLDPNIYPSYTDFCLSKAEKDIPLYKINKTLELFFVTRGSVYTDFSNFVGAAVYLKEPPILFDKVTYTKVYELDRFGIMPNYQGKGIGTNIMKLAESILDWNFIHLCTRSFHTGKYVYRKLFIEISHSPSTGQKAVGYHYYYKLKVNQ